MLPKPYFQDSHVTLYHGDCREILPHLAPVDHVITDPPYSEHVHGKSRRGGKSAPALDGSGRYCPSSFSRVKEFGFESLSPDLRAFCAKEFARLVARWVLVFSDVEMCHEWRADLVSLDYVRTGAWIKIGATPQFSGDRPAAGFEAVTICHRHGRKRWNGGGAHAIWSEPIVLNRGGNDPRLHTTQKPIHLMTRLVGLFTDPGETILDPFMGSGTTLRAAKDMGRRAIGIERDEKYCEAAAKRMGQEVLNLDAA